MPTSDREKADLLAEIEDLRRQNAALRQEICPWHVNDKTICKELTLVSFDAFIIVNIDDGIMTAANAAAETLFGRPQAELVGMHFTELHPPADPIMSPLPSLAENGPSSRKELRTTIRTATGNALHVSVIVQPLESDGRPQALLQYRDITESIEADEDNRKLFDLSLDIICVADINKEVFERVNPAFTRVLGYPIEEVEGHSYMEFLHPDDIEPTARVVEEQLKAGKEVINFQNRHRHKNGEYRWLQWFTHPDIIRGKNYAVGRDITEAKHFEEKLKASEDRYSSLYNAMREGMAIHKLEYDNNGEPVNYRILEVNTQYEAILGIPRNSAIGTLGTELYQSEEAPYLDKFVEVVKNGETATFQTYFPPLDKHFHISVIFIKKDMFATVFEDLTDFLRTREQLEQSLHELSNAKSMLNTVFHQAPIPMIVVYPKDMKIGIANAAVSDILGIPEDVPLEGRRLLDVERTWQAFDAAGNILKKDDNPLIEGLKGTTTSGFEFRIVRQDGTERWGVAYCSPIYNDNNELIAAFSTFPDITEHKKTLEKMIQAEKMATMSILATGMAHEINNPLAGVVGGSKLLRKRLLEEHSKNQKTAEQCGTDFNTIQEYARKRSLFDIIETIDKMGERASDLVGTLLTFAAPEEEGYVPLQVAELLDSAVELVRDDLDLQDCDLAKFKIERHYDTDIPDIKGHGTSLKEALYNILKNGVQACTFDGTPELTLSVSNTDYGVQIEIRDNGQGLSKEEQARVFDPFFTTHTVGAGLGLGLSIAFFIITTIHSGTLSVNSEVGQGTTFRVIIPRDSTLMSSYDPYTGTHRT